MLLDNFGLNLFAKVRNFITLPWDKVDFVIIILVQCGGIIGRIGWNTSEGRGGSPAKHHGINKQNKKSRNRRLTDCILLKKKFSKMQSYFNHMYIITKKVCTLSQNELKIQVFQISFFKIKRPNSFKEETRERWTTRFY